MLRTPKSFRFLISASAVLLAISGFAPVAHAQGSDEAIEEIITTGTRRAERTASDSAIPIDVIGGDDFENVGTPDMDDMLRNTLPSYNVQRHAIDDAATLVRPATMRGLPPDNVLILVNGKRRHRSGVIAELGGSLAAGSQGADLASIPAMGIKQVEVLRDGASAQYGSDAIAGVMNFVLRDAADGLAVEARYGEFLEGDGTLSQIAGNIGLPLGNDGFANITAQYRVQDPTIRSTQRTDAETLIRTGAPDQTGTVRQPFAQIWGAPEYRDDWNVFLNSGITLSSSQEVYLFGNIGARETEGGFFYRNPNSRSGVFTFDQGGTTWRTIVDQNLQGFESGVVSNCTPLASPGSGSSGADLDPGTVDADWTARQAIAGTNCWLANEVMPGGYTPQFGGQLEDSSLVFGVRGEFNNGMSYDFSGSAGRNQVEFFLNNTWNPSRGPDGITADGLQRDFNVGTYQQRETNLNADFVWPIDMDAFASPLNFAFGAEWRNEQFQTRIGEVNSWEGGRFSRQTGPDPAAPNCYADPAATPPFTYPDDCIDDGTGSPLLLPNLSIGSHGFAGFSPQQAGTWDRANYAVYADLEADVTESFLVGVAVRFEDFQDFGTTTNGKIAARWALTDTFALRGSASTGFRAPTPGQNNVTKVSTTTIDGELQQRGQIPPTNPIAMAFGAQQLKPEDATNVSLGLTWDITDTLNLSFDTYQINVTDRITQTGSIVISSVSANDPRLADVPCPGAKAADANAAICLEEAGVPGASVLNSISFYTNDFETTTTGIDLVATWAIDFGGAGTGDLTAAWNWTETEVDNAGNEVSRNRVVDIENFNPKNRGIFTYNHFIGDFRFLARASYYDEWISGDFSADAPANPVDYTVSCTVGDDKCYGAEWILDLEAAYTFNDTWSVMVGATNIADNNGPVDDDNLDGTIGSGNTYEQGTPFGQDGGFWYFRVRADFE